MADLNLNQQQLIEIAKNELEKPTQPMTRPYLEIFSFKKDNQNKYHIARVVESSFFHSKTSVVYFSNEDQKLFLAVYIKDGSVYSVDIQSGHQVYLTATSDTLTSQELSDFIKNLNITRQFSKGDLRLDKKNKFKFSRISVDPMPIKAYPFEEKLSLLLDYLEKDTQGIRDLIANSDAVVSVCKYHYVSSYDAPSFSANTIKRLNNLHLGVDISLYPTGKHFS